MAQETRSFRSSVLGFDRNDVINYIETLSREHSEELDAFRSAAEVLRGERDDARRELAEKDALIATLKAQNEEMLRQSELDEQSKQRAADMELTAYKRAQEIEAEAIHNAEKARSALLRLLRDTRGKYSAARGEMGSLAFNVMEELTRMRDWFDSFPRLFDEIDDKLDSIMPPEAKAADDTYQPYED